MNAPLVKICGLTHLEDTLAAIELGADLLGFNFYPGSARFLPEEEAQRIFQEIPTNIPKVGIFVNEELEAMIDLSLEFGLDFLQLHGDETPELCNSIGHPWYPALRPSSEEDLEMISKYESEYVLIDSAQAGEYGGTGKTANWELARTAKNFGKKVILAGGLNPDNVQAAIATVQPYAVDVASGVESRPGRKDFKKMEEFIERAKNVPLKLIG